MTYFLIVIRQIAQFILFAGIGVIAAKTKIITRENIGMLSKLVVRIALPTMTTIAMQAEIQRSDADYSSGMVFMTTLLSILTIPAVCLLIGHL